jgi:VanZ family protein
MTLNHIETAKHLCRDPPGDARLSGSAAATMGVYVDDRTEWNERFLLTWLPPALWALVIFLGSSLPGSAIPGNLSVPGHLAEYAVLGALLFLALRRTVNPKSAAWLALAISSAYGATDELHQLFVPGRVADPIDWALDTLGAALGIALAVLLVSRALRLARRQ